MASALTRLLLALAASFMPAAQRGERYREWVADAAEMPPGEGLEFAATLLWRAYDLRLALLDRAPSARSRRRRRVGFALGVLLTAVAAVALLPTGDAPSPDLQVLRAENEELRSLTTLALEQLERQSLQIAQTVAAIDAPPVEGFDGPSPDELLRSENRTLRSLLGDLQRQGAPLTERLQQTLRP